LYSVHLPLLQATVFPFLAVATVALLLHACPVETATAAFDAGEATTSSEPITTVAKNAACDFFTRCDVEKFMHFSFGAWFVAKLASDSKTAFLWAEPMVG